ncbi:MAG: phage portal protein [Candidatus Faecalibacterium intestinavium]|uniref:Phage portal protein n=1 Tax=Candidatus Faecalibacterium intestinavium TaxID=2838580 RepID=A0A9E2NQ17_9FIRM|nr:phage portal protein [Candidatus Faecalibacterium intestinavium]
MFLQPGAGTARWNRIIDAGRALTETEFFGREIAAWKGSPQRLAQLDGERYYRNDQDILRRRRMAIGADGELKEVRNLPNNKIIDNQYALRVDQKVNYLLGKPVSFSCESEPHLKLLRARFGPGFQRTLKYIGEDALNGGIAWLYVYYDAAGALAFRRFPGYEVLPFWADDDHTQLDAAARLYRQEVWEGTVKKTIERVELYKPEGIYRYLLEGSTLIPDGSAGEYAPYLTVAGEHGPEAYAWERFPLIPFKYNKQEIPLLARVRSLQDGINAILSDFENNTQEDARNTILVLKDFDGENLGEFRQNLAAYGAVKIRSDGGVDTLTVTVNPENYKVIVELFKKALIENARGFDAKDERLSGSPNQMNIRSMYSDIDLDANGMETEFKAAFEQLLWFVHQDAKTKGLGDFSADPVTVVFDRDILLNESEAIQNCSASVGILSEETILEQHPWTKDAKTELARLKQERQAQQADSYTGAFSQNGQSRPNP